MVAPNPNAGKSSIDGGGTKELLRLVRILDGVFGAGPSVLDVELNAGKPSREGGGTNVLFLLPAIRPGVCELIPLCAAELPTSSLGGGVVLLSAGKSKRDGGGASVLFLRVNIRLAGVSSIPLFPTPLDPSCGELLPLLFVPPEPRCVFVPPLSEASLFVEVDLLSPLPPLPAFPPLLF